MQSMNTPLADNKSKPTKLHYNPQNAYLAFDESHKDTHTRWWFINLIIHDNFVLFIPAFLIWHYNAPMIVLAIAILAFLINLVVNISGASVRVTHTAFIGSLLVNLLMVLIYVF
jgi:hypothetical protein